MDEWYYSEGTAQKGPISLKQLKSIFLAGKLTGATLVFGPNMKDWVPASQVPNLVPPGTGLPSGKNQQDLSAENFHKTGLAHAKNMENDKAIIAYDKAIQLNSRDPVIYKNRADAHLAMENHEKALADYNKAIELNPNYVIAYINRSYYHLTLESYDEAIADCDKAIELDPKKAVAYFHRGSAYEAQKAYDAAKSDYNTAIKLDPDFVDAKTARENLIGRRKDTNKSESWSEDSMVIHSKKRDNKYPMLESMSFIYEIFGYLFMLFIIIATGFIANDMPDGKAAIITISFLAGGLVVFIGIMACSQLIKLLMDIEFNLRQLRSHQK